MPDENPFHEGPRVIPNAPRSISEPTGPTFHGPQFGVSRDALLAKAKSERQAALCAEHHSTRLKHEARAEAFEEATKL